MNAENVQNVISIIGAAAAFPLCVYGVVNANEWNRNTIMTITAMVSLFVGLFFEISQVYLYFDRLLGVTNVPILIVWITFGLMTHCFCIVLSRVAKREINHPLDVLFCGYIIAILIVWYFYVLGTESYFNHALPRSTSDAVFLSLLFGLSTIHLVLVYQYAFLLLMCHDEFIAKIRTSLLILVAVMGVSFFGIRLIMSSLYFILPQVGMLHMITNLLQVAIVIVSIAIFLRKKRFLTLFDPVIRTRKLIMLKRLESLISMIRRYQSPIVNVRVVGVRDRYKKVDFLPV